LELTTFTPKSCRLGLIDNPEGNRDLAAAMRSGNCFAGINGGYFDENFAPLGLRINGGKTTSNLAHGRLLTGVMMSSDSLVRILRVSEFAKSTRAFTAVQSGPFLIDHGRIVPGL